MPPKRAKAAPKTTRARAAPVVASKAVSTRRKGGTEEAQSDSDETGLVKPSARGANTTKPRHVDEDVMVAGGLGRRDSEEAGSQGVRDGSSRPQEAHEDEVVAAAPVRRVGRPARTVKKLAQSEAQKRTLEGLKKRMEAAKQVRSGENHTVPEMLEEIVLASVPDEPQMQRPEDDKRMAEAEHKLDIVGKSVSSTVAVSVLVQPPSTFKAQSTPAAAEHSILANFKRRARQPSILQMVQQTTVADTTHGTLENDEDEEEDFRPEDESTPLQVNRPSTPTVPLSPPTAQHYDSDDLYTATPRAARKRKSDEIADDSGVQVVQSSPIRIPSHALGGDESSQGLPEDPADIFNVPGTNPDDLENQTEQERLLSDTYADPLSSSPPRSPIARRERLHTQPAGIRRGRPQRNAQVKHPGNNPELPTALSEREQTSLSTAKLQALLPKRRRKLHADPTEDEFDIPSSDSIIDTTAPPDDDEDEDELNPTARPRRRRPAHPSNPAKKPTNPTKTTTTPAKPTRGKLRSTTTSPTLTKRNSAKKSAAAQQQHQQQQQKPARTYGARLSSDKENVGTPDGGSEDGDGAGGGGGDDTDTTHSIIYVRAAVPGKKVTGGDGEMGGRKGKGLSREMEAARQKFLEVDQWELSFESVDLGGGSSSPWR
ncbi:hypothetical protein LTR66_003292 [Elasticomyces elasticus]|nr:hypothetical protein LTR66_003292 [Elasticomyces elasticus]KAK5009950.1 hypothetical protein LTR28_012577 [Elasticomyces elasticus]